VINDIPSVVSIIIFFEGEIMHGIPERSKLDYFWNYLELLELLGLLGITWNYFGIIWNYLELYRNYLELLGVNVELYIS
jgi:hypothetical protein